MTFDKTERTLLAGLADRLIPAGKSFPAASQAGVADEGLDLVLSARPDLGGALKEILQLAKDRIPAEAVADLQARNPAGFVVLAEVVSGAYFLNAQVRAALGYAGQVARPIDPKPDYLEDGLLQSVLD